MRKTQEMWVQSLSGEDSLEEGLRRPSRHRNHTHGVGEAGTRAPPGQHNDNVSLLEEASGLSWRKRRELVNEKLSQEGIHLGVQFSPVAHWCPTLCDPMNRNTPGLPVHHQLPEFTQTHVHRVGDAIQPSHPLSSPSPPAPNPSQHQSLFQ